ncbi:MAG: EVE domain-containing protein [Dehalococcoidia bacterium]|nr:EVE domain-containing protein [Dehalococcoidia bacterium]
MPASAAGGPVNYWMIAISPENWRVTKEHGLTVQGFTTRQRKKVERMAPGDRLLFYVKDRRVFSATATVTATASEDRSRLWTASDPQEFFPHRVRIRSEAVMPEGKGLDANLIAPRMEYLKRWPPERWYWAMVGELHILPRKDLELVEWEMLKILRPGWLPPKYIEPAIGRRPRRVERPYPAAAAGDGAGVNPNPAS